MLNRVLKEIEKTAIKYNGVCRECGTFLVKKGSDAKKIKTLLGVVEIKKGKA